MDEIIRNGWNGLIVPKNDPHALAEAINFISSDDRKAREFGINGYNEALKKFTPKNGMRFEKIYEELTN
jgi:glycosyltransferase involved in cell wall biosynthesis